ncbi:MAG: PHP domain-containing protein, partial [Patescibacteria group bacterium]
MTKQQKFTNREISHLLRSVSAAYLIKNGNRFKKIAFDNAAEVVEKLTREIKDIWQEGQLEKIEGIGRGIAYYLDEYLRTGNSKHFNEVFKGIPLSVFEMMKLQSLGPLKAFAIAKELKIINKDTAFKKLKEAASQGKIAKLEGFGERSQKAILEALRIYKKKSIQSYRMPLPTAYDQAIHIKEYLQKHKKVVKVEVLGSLRRMNPTIGDLDLAVQTKDEHRKDIINYFLKYPGKISTEVAGENKASIVISSGTKVDIRLQKKQTWGTLLQYFTGSKIHNIRLRELAQKKSLSISEYGIKEEKGKLHTFNNEKDFYNFLNLQYIPPEIREGTQEVELAKQNKIPLFIDLKDIKGDFHIHSSYPIKSSHDYGTANYSQIADKAIKLGYSYLGFSDHNPKISGQDEKDIVKILRKRKDTIKKQMKNKAIKYFIGLEVDILIDGKLAVPNEGFKYLDYMIVSIHSAFHMNIKDMTDRVLKGLSNEKVKILAHPTGRLIGKREGY